LESVSRLNIWCSSSISNRHRRSSEACDACWETTRPFESNWLVRPVILTGGNHGTSNSPWLATTCAGWHLLRKWPPAASSTQMLRLLQSCSVPHLQIPDCRTLWRPCVLNQSQRWQVQYLGWNPVSSRTYRQHLASSCTFPWVPESADTTHGWLLWLSSTLLGIQTSARVPIATWDVMF